MGYWRRKAARGGLKTSTQKDSEVKTGKKQKRCEVTSSNGGSSEHGVSSGCSQPIHLGVSLIVHA